MGFTTVVVQEQKGNPRRGGLEDIPLRIPGPSAPRPSIRASPSFHGERAVTQPSVTKLYYFARRVSNFPRWKPESIGKIQLSLSLERERKIRRDWKGLREWRTFKLFRIKLAVSSKKFRLNCYEYRFLRVEEDVVSDDRWEVKEEET